MLLPFSITTDKLSKKLWGQPDILVGVSPLSKVVLTFLW
jgi:hypothetical protein